MIMRIPGIWYIVQINLQYWCWIVTGGYLIDTVSYIVPLCFLGIIYVDEGKIVLLLLYIFIFIIYDNFTYIASGDVLVSDTWENTREGKYPLYIGHLFILSNFNTLRGFPLHQKKRKIGNDSSLCCFRILAKLLWPTLKEDW